MAKTSTKNVVITGCSSGFGNLAAKTLAKDGHRVFATMRDIRGRNAESARQLSEWAKQQQVSIEVAELDVSDEASIETAVRGILSSVPCIDVLVNNAGFVGLGALEAFTLDQVESLFDVNTFGPLRVNRAVLPSMRKNKSGLVIHISSGSGRFYMPFLGAYCAAKFALEAFSEAYAYELAPFGIDVIVIEPGGHRTEIQQKIMEPDPSQRTTDYAESKARIQDKMIAALRKEYDGPNAPKAQNVADTVKQMVDMPQGQRPFRTVVGRVATAGVDDLNRDYEKHKRSMLKSMGVG